MTTSGLARPCIHPKCRDMDGNPWITTQVMCPGCRRRYLADLHALALDWIILNATLPARSRVVTGQRTRTGTRTFGHPAEWASDMCALIAQTFAWVEESVRHYTDGGPPPRRDRIVMSEATLIRRALPYLVNRLDRLVTFRDAEQAVIEITELHRQIRAGRGYVRIRRALPVPCPRCELVALGWEPGEGAEYITCGNCGHRIPQVEWGWFARVVLDEAIDAYDRAAG